MNIHMMDYLAMQYIKIYYRGNTEENNCLHSTSMEF